MPAPSRRRSFGVGIAAVGVMAAAMSLQLPIGTLRTLGPGAFPLFVAATLMMLGVTIAAANGTTTSSTRSTPASRYALQVLAAVLAFGVSVERAGLLAATVLLIVLSSLHDVRRRPLAIAVLAIVVAISSALLFVWLLGLPVPILPRGLD